MKISIKDSLLNIRASCQIRCWQRELKCVPNFNMDCRVLDVKENNILYFVPHADDDLISGYQFFKTYSDKLLYVYFGLTGSNNSEDNRLIREKEFHTYCEKINAPYCNVYKKSVVELSKILKRYNSYTVVLPSLIDWHFEHRLLNYLLYDTLMEEGEKNVSVIWYNITVPICLKGKRIIPLTKKEQDEKYKIFEDIYISQRFMPVERLKIQEEINARGTEYYAAENFFPMKADKWCNIVNKVREMEGNEKSIRSITKLKSDINNLLKIRRRSERLYKELFGDEC